MVKLVRLSSFRTLIAEPDLNLIQPGTMFRGLMYRRHVYGNPAQVTPEFVETRWRTTQQSGARFAPAAFVTGSLAPVQNRDDFLAWFQPLSAPVLVVIGEQTPSKSRAEMDALTTLPVSWSRRVCSISVFP